MPVETRVKKNSAYKVQAQVIDSEEGLNVEAGSLYYFDGELRLGRSDGTTVSLLSEGATGWADYSDTEFTEVSPLSVVANTPTVLANNAGSVNESQLPVGVESFYNPDLPILNYDGEVSAFTVGETITGADSGATAVIDSITDNGADGSLFLVNLQGEFQDNETITDSATGEALVNGNITPGKILGLDGDNYLITLEAKVKPTTTSATTRIITYFDIGLPDEVQLYRREQLLSKGQNVEHYVTLTTSYYTLDTWARNGGIFYIQGTAAFDLYDIRFVISRIHKAL